MQIPQEMKFDANGLIPAVIQDFENNQVLMVGYMNLEAVERTIQTRRVTFWSRSRQQFWVKGETSGHYQYVKAIYTDCDKDCVLVQVEQVGAACHEGYRTCFFRQISEDGNSLEVLGEPLTERY